MSNSQWVAALSGQQIGGYRLGAYLGGGQFGMVFEATGPQAGSPHAIKLLTPSNDPDAAADFETEGRLLRTAVKCSNVINLIDSDSDSVQMNLNGFDINFSFRYHVLSLASGVLEELILDPAIRAQLTWPDRLSHWRGAVKGVHQLHLHNIAHRDLKSSNCLLMVSGRRTEVRVADLGRSKDLTLPPTVAPNHYLAGRGDLRYAPPEYLWLMGGSTAADFKNADLYGLGSLLVELATGHPMTASAMGDFGAQLHAAQQDLINGVTRDLATLRPRFRRVIDEVGEEFPRSIRHDAVTLLTQLCDPVPSQRLPLRRTGKRIPHDDGLVWLLRRVDILSRQLAVEGRRHNSKAPRIRSRSAS